MVAFLLLFPILVMVMELVVVGGRLAVVTADVQSAAREAARQASIAANGGSAAGLVRPVAATSLEDRGIECESFEARLGGDTDFVAGGHVSTFVACTVRLSDLGLFLTPPATVRITKTAREPIDTYRIVS